MKNNKDAWETLASEYIQKVEKALSRVDHPRKKEVLADLSAHLEQIYAEIPDENRTPENLAGIIDLMGPPEEYAELLSPARGAAPREWSRRRRIGLLAGAVVVLVAGFMGLPDKRVLRYKIRETFGWNYSANPFFSEENFKKIQPGMTEGQVRDLIGFPLDHSWVVGGKDFIRWDYTTAAAAGDPSWRVFEVSFGKQTRKVVEKLTCRGSCVPEGADASRVFHVAGFKKKVGSLRLTRLDGTELVLTDSDNTIYLIWVEDFYGRVDLKEYLDPIISESRTEFEWAKKEGVHIFYLLYGSTAKAGVKYPENIFVSADPQVRIPTAGLRCINKGTSITCRPFTLDMSKKSIARTGSGSFAVY
jgi:outer membrane protein assembly factor BamE (lipoprotein component of BamABCDE complex)